MSAPARPDLHACTHCRLRFASRRALRRHESLDHRPAPDGARLTAQLLAGLPSAVEPRVAAGDDVTAAPVLLADPPAPPAARAQRPPPARRGPTGPRVGVLVVVALVALVLGHAPLLALGAAVLTWALCCARSSLTGRTARSPRPDPQE